MTPTIKLNPHQNAALADLNVALYRAKNTGVLAMLPQSSFSEAFYQSVGDLCVQTNGRPLAERDEDATFTARVKAVMHDRDCFDEELIVLTMGVSNPDIYRLNMPMEPWPPKEAVSRYEVLISRADMKGQVLIVLPPEIDHLLEEVHQIMFCRVPATFRPQAWVNNRAIDQDDGECHFNAVKGLIKLDLNELQDMFEENVDFDCLADGLPEREAHGGPFEVDVDEAAVLRIVCLLSGHAGALDENDSVADITQPMWDDFVSIAFDLERLTGGQASLPETNDSTGIDDAPR